MNTHKIQEAINAPLPAPPAGFVWQLYEDATFLKPSTWYERERATTTNAFPVTTYATSPEHFSQEKPFEMGLTLQVIRDSQKIIGVAARQVALVYLKPFRNAHKEKDVLLFEHDTKGEFDHIFFRYRDAPPGLKPSIVHKYIVANNITDSVHAFTFESPAPSWDENWAQYGTPILSHVGVDSVMRVPRIHNNLQ